VGTIVSSLALGVGSIGDVRTVVGPHLWDL
jgi:hypothetical protein